MAEAMARLREVADALDAEDWMFQPASDDELRLL